MIDIARGFIPLTAVHCFDNAFVEKQSVTWKEHCVEYSYKELQESMCRCPGRIAEILFKTAFTPKTQPSNSFIHSFMILKGILPKVLYSRHRRVKGFRQASVQKYVLLASGQYSNWFTFYRTYSPHTKQFWILMPIKSLSNMVKRGKMQITSIFSFFNPIFHCTSVLKAFPFIRATCICFCKCFNLDKHNMFLENTQLLVRQVYKLAHIERTC